MVNVAARRGMGPEQRTDKQGMFPYMKPSLYYKGVVNTGEYPAEPVVEVSSATATWSDLPNAFDDRYDANKQSEIDEDSEFSNQGIELQKLQIQEEIYNRKMMDYLYGDVPNPPSSP
jgi:hypothetical protein